MTVTVTGTLGIQPPSPIGFSPVISVKDYGATGNGVTDDTMAIQAAFTAAFGAWNGTPNGNTNKKLNIPVYFPAGTYNTSAPLYLVEVYGGLIFGEGQDATVIHFVPGANGNAIIPSPTATVTGSITTTTLTITAVLSQFLPFVLESGGTLSGSGVTVGTTLGSQLTSSVSGTHGAASGTTTFTDATANAFTSAMVGTHLVISAGSLSLGTYIIKTFISASQVTLNFVPGNASGATWHLNGWTGTYTVSPSQSAGSTTISVASAGSEITPCIMTNGYGYVTMRGITLTSPTTPTSVNNITGFFYYSNVSSQLDSGTSTACRWVDMNITQFWIGMIVGWGIGSGNNQENCVLENVNFSQCPMYGLRLLNQNVLNWTSVGGGAAICGTAAIAGNLTGAQAGGYSLAGSSITIISPSMSANGWDFVAFNPSAPLAIMGGSAEGGNVAGTNYGQNTIGLNGAAAYVSGFCLRGGLDAGYVFATLISAQIVFDGCTISPGTSSAGTFVDLGNNGIVIIDNPYYGSNASGMGFAGATNSLIYYRGSVQLLNTTPFTGFSGRIAEYNPWVGGGDATPTVANLPTPSAIWKGVRMVVTDSTVTASGHFGSIVAGTSTNTVPVFCDGTNWLIG